MDHVRLPKRKRSSLSAEQKAAFVILMFLGIGGVILGFLSFGANISRPFDIQLAQMIESSDGDFMLSSEREAAEVEAQKTRDTDGDGLNDYDELNVFKTSPYLDDSDSDGFSDKDEVYSGNNPNCPSGKVCSGVVASQEQIGDNAIDPNDLIDGPLPSSSFSGSNTFSDLDTIEFTSEEEAREFFSSMTIEQIRQALADAGVPEDTLDAIDDESLKQAFTESVDSAAEGGRFQEALNEDASQTE